MLKTLLCMTVALMTSASLFNEYSPATAYALKTTGQLNERHTVQSPESSHRRYMGLGLTEPSAVSKTNTTFFPKSTDFEPHIQIYNGLPQTSEYVVSFFDNYKQIPVTYNQRLVNVIKCHVSQWSSTNLDVTIPSLHHGVHYIDCVAIREPFAITTKFEPPQRTFIAKRIVVRIGTANSNTATRTIDVHQDPNSTNSAVGLPYFTDGRVAELSKAIGAAEEGNLYLNFQPKITNMDYAVMFLLDYHQITKGVPYPFFHVKSEGNISMPVRINVPHDNKPHVLMALVVPNPFKSIETEDGQFVEPEARFPWMIYSSNKVTIQN